MVDAKQLVGGVVLAYGVAFVLTWITGVLAVVLDSVFTTGTFTFASVYNSIRGLTLFIILFPISVSLITFAFVGDLFFDFLLPFLNDNLGTTFPVTLDLATTVGKKDQGIIGAFIDIAVYFFPEMK